MGNGEGSVVTVKNWHVVLALITWLVTCSMAFASLYSRAEETARRVSELENTRVEQKQFDQLKEDILRRLQRIEDKLDRDRALRAIQ